MQYYFLANILHYTTSKYFMRKFLLLFLSSLIFVTCEPRETELVILSMNDIHAKIDHLDKLAAYIQAQRSQYSDVLLLSAGDLFSGNPIVDYYPEKGYPIIDLMNYMKFDATTLGNHEFDYGQDILQQRIEQANFPFVCSNISLSNLPAFPVQRVFELKKSGQKISITGILQENVESHPKNLEGVQLSSPSVSLETYSHIDANMHIAITHQGVTLDSVLAVRHPYLDLIVGGHSHTLLDTGLFVNGVLITQAGKYAQYISKTYIKFKNGKIISKSTEVIEVDTLKCRDSVMSKKIAGFNGNNELNRKIGELSQSIVGKVNIGNFFCDMVRASTNSDIVFQNIHGIRIDSLVRGDITLKKLYNADPFGNEIIQFEMTKIQLQEFIANNYNTFKRLDLCVSGAHYRIAKNKQNVKVDLCLPNTQLLSFSKNYKVAMNSYMAQTYWLPNTQEGKNLLTTNVDATLAYLLTHPIIIWRAEERGIVR
ncbi:MAG: bifunctional metallophosphatase/5'-nucleotidase [Bacteroidales bacterium]